MSRTNNKMSSISLLNYFNQLLFHHLLSSIIKLLIMSCNILVHGFIGFLHTYRKSTLPQSKINARCILWTTMFKIIANKIILSLVSLNLSIIMLLLLIKFKGAPYNTSCRIVLLNNLYISISAIRIFDPVKTKAFTSTVYIRA